MSTVKRNKKGPGGNRAPRDGNGTPKGVPESVSEAVAVRLPGTRATDQLLMFGDPSESPARDLHDWVVAELRAVQRRQRAEMNRVDRLLTRLAAAGRPAAAESPTVAGTDLAGWTLPAGAAETAPAADDAWKQELISALGLPAGLAGTLAGLGVMTVGYLAFSRECNERLKGVGPAAQQKIDAALAAFHANRAPPDVARQSAAADGCPRRPVPKPDSGMYTLAELGLEGMEIGCNPGVPQPVGRGKVNRPGPAPAIVTVRGWPYYCPSQTWSTDGRGGRRSTLTLRPLYSPEEWGDRPSGIYWAALRGATDGGYGTGVLCETADGTRYVVGPADESLNVLVSEDRPGQTTTSAGGVRSCRVCGCTDDDCSQCVAKTGEPCQWVDADLCSACAQLAAAEPQCAQGRPSLITAAVAAHASIRTAGGTFAESLAGGVAVLRDAPVASRATGPFAVGDRVVVGSLPGRVTSASVSADGFPLTASLDQGGRQVWTTASGAIRRESPPVPAWDFVQTFPPVPQDRVEEFMADFRCHNADADHIGPPEECARATAEATIEQLKGRRRAAAQVRATLADGVNPSTGRKLPAKQREALTDDLADLADEQGLLDNYAAWFGDDAAEAMRRFVEAAMSADVPPAPTASPARRRRARKAA